MRRGGYFDDLNASPRTLRERRAAEHLRLPGDCFQMQVITEHPPVTPSIFIQSPADDPSPTPNSATHLVPPPFTRPSLQRNSSTRWTLRPVEFVSTPEAVDHQPWHFPVDGGPPQRITPRLFGLKTRFRPLWLLGLGNVGNILYGLGSVVIQRAVWPSKMYDPEHRGANIPSGTPGLGTAFGGPIGGVAGGTAMTVAGISISILAASLTLNDGHSLARQRNPDNPSFKRVNTYFGFHLLSIAMLVGNRFAIELFRVYLPNKWQFAGAMPGALGQAIFAITQAQGFSNAELFSGMMPLPNRAAISATARAFISAYIVVGTIQSSPNIDAYAREGVRLVAQTATAVAFSLPLTTARIAADQERVPPRELDRPWRALGNVGLYAVARLASAIAAQQIAHSAWPVRTPPRQLAVRWPPPLPTEGADVSAVVAQSVLLAAATTLAITTFIRSHADARRVGRRYANAMLAASVCSIAFGQIYRVQMAYGREHVDFKTYWEAMPIGVVANALAFIALPESFGASEVAYGETPIPYRYHVTEACRATGGVLWSLWAASSGVVTLDPTFRLSLVWGASIATMLGLAFPTAETRRAQRGAAA